MSITFHCDYCNKKIEAPDNAGGKWGKCPSCHNKLYIPAANADDEELTLAPVDEDEERRKRELMAETRRLEQDILLEKDVPPEGVEPPTSDETEPVFVSEVPEKELTEKIILYLRNMADGELERAEEISAMIVTQGKKAIQIIDDIALSEIPEPELADIPQQILSGFIRNLRAQIA